ncbi:DUF4157 domain-containing protein [Nostoc paludosum FACHB-159]|uniref:DUF4157 domain-containing protein n=2 Tax=Nostoc TaxID=1177 RepID=A0ABR8KGE6_9NOSO|nr:DUF4157 domain-containing protein [Nostoc sp. FACHB-857]MBD2737958.1 DUF4157 domain-containing protein [Nostoc paludosum FACHB-159]
MRSHLTSNSISTATLADNNQLLAPKRQDSEANFSPTNQLKTASRLSLPTDGVVQTKLTIGKPNDRYEQEANRVATSVVRQINLPSETQSGVVQGKEKEGHGLRKKPQPMVQRQEAIGGGEASTDLTSAINSAKGGGQPLDAGLQQSMGQAMGADFSGVRVHTDKQSDQLNQSIQAKAFTTGQDVFFRQGAYEPGSCGGQELIAHELTHVVQQNGNEIRRKQTQQRDDQNTGSDISICSTRSDQVQRRFGFEIELPMLFTHKANIPVPSLAGGGNIAMNNVPIDAGMGGRHTNLVDMTVASHCYLNVDHSRTLNKLYEAELDQYAADNHLNQNEQDSLQDYRGTLMPSHASIVEVVTTAWDENTLSRTQVLARVQGVVNAVNDLYDDIDNDTQAAVGAPLDAYYIGSDSPNSSLFQPRLGYFHATYGIKLAQVPHLFKQTTQQKNRMARYAEQNLPEKEHAKNVELTKRSVAVAKTAMTAIKRLWPTVNVTRKFLPDTTKIDLSSAAEKDFLGFLTLLCNYFMLMNEHTGGGDLAKKLVGMHYYKSDLYDVASQLPTQVINKLRAVNTTLIDQVIDEICTAVGINNTDTLNDALSGYTVRGYLYQIFRGHFGVIQDNNTGLAQQDASNNTFIDPVLADSINPYSSKLGPEQLGPVGRQGIGVVMENRHLEYLNPAYGTLLDTDQEKQSGEVIQYGPPKAGLDTRTALEKAMYDSIGARAEGPAKRPIAEWEGMMMGIYDMVKAINNRI